MARLPCALVLNKHFHDATNATHEYEVVPKSILALKDYSRQKFIADLIAGVTVGWLRCACHGVCHRFRCAPQQACIARSSPAF